MTFERQATDRRRQPVAQWARKLAWLVVPLALVGEFGHHLLEHMGQTLAHHLFHVLFAGGAAVVFGVCIVLDVRRNGWPTFSWRADPPVPQPPGPSGRVTPLRGHRTGDLLRHL